MNTMEIQSLNRDITNDRISMPYPHIKLLEPTDAVALVLPSFPEGQLPVICEYNGACRQIGSIVNSAIFINKLSKISRIEYHKDANMFTEIKTSLDAVEVLI